MNMICAPSGVSVHVHEPSKMATSPSSWRKSMWLRSGSKVSSSTQQSTPARKFTSHREMVDPADASVTVTERTALANSG